MVSRGTVFQRSSVCCRTKLPEGKNQQCVVAVIVVAVVMVLVFTFVMASATCLAKDDAMNMHFHTHAKCSQTQTHHRFYNVMSVQPNGCDITSRTSLSLHEKWQHIVLINVESVQPGTCSERSAQCHVYNLPHIPLHLHLPRVHRNYKC